MKRSIFVFSLAAVISLGALSMSTRSATAAPPDFLPAEQLCERSHDGDFVDLGELAYVCLVQGPEGANAGQIRAAEAVCENVYNGALFVAVGNRAYACVLPSSPPL